MPHLILATFCEWAVSPMVAIVWWYPLYYLKGWRPLVYSLVSTNAIKKACTLQTTENFQGKKSTGIGSYVQHVALRENDKNNLSGT